MLSFIESAIAQLKEKDSIREQIIKNSRELVRISRSIVVNTHNSNDVKDLIQQSKEIVNNIISMLKIYPDLIDSARNALQEYAEDLGFTMHPHPTLSESIMEASEDALGKPIHILKRKIK